MARIDAFSTIAHALALFVFAVVRAFASKAESGRKFGPYTLEEKIGEGGMGEVYKARHALLRRTTAIKLIRNASSRDQRARFEREVQLTSQLTHPNTVHVYDYGRTLDGTLYYAMEYIEGLTLWQLVQLDGALPPGRAVALLLQVCASLAEAHGFGVIHRDVKPDNVLVCVRGLVPDVVKVVDFGLARAFAGDAEDDPDTLVGTARYMSPEAVRQPSRLDARSDVYSLGALAYFLLTGTELFHGTTDLVLSQQLHSVPQRPSSRLGAELPPGLDEIVMRCLAKEPDMRPQSVAELAAELGRVVPASAWTEVDGAAWWQRNADAVVALLRAASSDDREPDESRAYTHARIDTTVDPFHAPGPLTLRERARAVRTPRAKGA
ncbi:MAG: Serine/threonine protein kinase [Labilithrix sp.]|nr:Serine/threonine protein kinase [Labilithrix sp.]